MACLSKELFLCFNSHINYYISVHKAAILFESLSKSMTFFAPICL